MNLEQVIAKEEADRKLFEAKTVGAKLDGREFTIAKLRSSFEKFHKADHWKDPVDVILDARTDDVVEFCQAVEFFQGDRPQVKGLDGCRIQIRSRGYMG